MRNVSLELRHAVIRRQAEIALLAVSLAINPKRDAFDVNIGYKRRVRRTRSRKVHASGVGAGFGRDETIAVFLEKELASFQYKWTL